MACAVTLAAGYALKAQCIGDWPWTGEQVERVCYNDIQPLYESRDIDVHTFPYIYSYLDENGPQYGGIEYPVLTGLFMWAMGFLADTPGEYLQVTAVALAVFGFLITWLLYRISGSRALYWAAAPTLVLYAFHNWDLLVVAAAVAALFAWQRGHLTAAAILIGIGGALKLYPLLFLGPLFLYRWVQGDRSGARRSLGWGLGACFLINLPIIYLNPPSWWLTYRFHRLRGPNQDSLWAVTFPGLGPSEINLLSAVLTGLTIVAVLWWCVKRPGEEGVFPFVQACAGVTAAFLLWSKVQSPQYMLWLLPFFVLLSIRLRWWVAFSVIDVIAYVGVFRYFNGVLTGAQFELFAYTMVFSVLARAALWAALIVVFTRADVAASSRPIEERHAVGTPSPGLA